MQHSIADSHFGVILEGRVQGVGFRWWARREATRLGLRGTVRNLADGSVEVHAAGDAEPLAAFLSALRNGPPGAVVSRVRPVTANAELPHDFRVIR